jgi:hypothetical protein
VGPAGPTSPVLRQRILTDVVRCGRCRVVRADRVRRAPAGCLRRSRAGRANPRPRRGRPSPVLAECAAARGESLGPAPTEPVERLGWEQRAGLVAAYREMSGHDDETSPLGPAPKAGKVEHRAAWHAAWRALGRPEAGREEAEMSDGQLLVRLRAYQREEAWAPAYVADELDGTSRAAVRYRQDAALDSAAGAARASRTTGGGAGTERGGGPAHRADSSGSPTRSSRPPCLGRRV